MRTKNAVIGQTGTVVLSETVTRQRSYKRTIRYTFTKVKDGWECWVCGPSIHTRTYGATGFGPKKHYAKASLERNLANNYGYLGQMVLLKDGEPTK